MIKLSIIIPVLNDLSAIRLTLDALRKQTYDKNNFEIIIIDNGSKDGCIEYLEKQNDVVFLKEHRYLSSPYSSRNRGIEISNGEYIAFLDATCVPREDFVQNGIDFFRNSACDMFGGNVQFYLDKNMTGSEICDSILHIRMKESITERQCCPLANVWVKKHVIESMGMFRENQRSGEDVAFTKRCTSAGYKLVFCKECRSFKFTRKFTPLLAKKIRVGKGKANVWREQNKLLIQLFSLWRYLVPILPTTFKKLLNRNKHIHYSCWQIMKAYSMSYLCKIVMLAGIINGILINNDKE